MRPYRAGRGFAAAVVLAGAVAAGQGCLRESNSVYCGGGFWCPSGRTCGADGKSCLPTNCGDGIQQSGEQCDPGSSGNIKDCNYDCTVPRCGDGIFNAAAGEECDDGAANSATGACLPDCRTAKCGDANVQSGVEACDDGRDSALEKTACPYGLKTCTLCSDCQWANLTGPFCGDGERQSDYEACDQGALNGATSCAYGTASCEICNGDCSSLVPRTGPTCGDGRRDADQGEACDDGLLNGALACAYGERECTLCSKDCKTSAGLGPYCGDGAVQSGNEACDQGALNGATSCAYGTAPCEICNGDCSRLVPRTGPTCGDGRRDADQGEACDNGLLLNGALACAYGERECALCSKDCKTSSVGLGPYCGDGVVQGGSGEQCDSDVSFVCGTCSAACLRQSIAKATGVIQVWSTNVSAGEAFAVDDGARTEVFEFVVGTSVPAAGHVPIALPGQDAGAGDPTALAQQIADAIAASGADGGLGIQVGLDGSAVYLTNLVASVNGNQPLRPMQDAGSIAQSPTPAGASAIVLQGMSGGVGCSSGELCASNDDCVSGSCLNKTCQ